MKTVLTLTSFVLFSTVANAACLVGYTPYGPFCAALANPRVVAVVELPPVDTWTLTPVLYTTPGLPFMSAYGDASKPPFVPDETASQKIAKMDGTSQQ